jgi:hypothetical protein
MTRTIIVSTAILALGCVASAGAQTKPKAVTGTKAGVGDAAKIQQALSAAPPDVRKGAMVMDWPATEGGATKMLRGGTNGWVCMPATPAPKGALGLDPMCLDKTFSDWAQAFMAHKDPPVPTTVGVGYMLRGDRGVSNTDPMATAPTADNHWIVSGPHVMMLVPNMAQLDALPTDPANGGPWVMWKGTKYAHLMVPVAAMPKAAPKK